MRGFLLCLFAAVLALFAGCSGDDDNGSSTTTVHSTDASSGGTTVPGTPTPEEQELSDRTFVSTEVTGHDLVRGTKVTLVFPNPAELTADAGCNSLGGAFTIEGGDLVVSGMRATLKGCSTELQAQDEWLSQFLQSKPKIGLSGNTLTLTGADATITLSDK